MPEAVFTYTIRRLALAGEENRESAAYWIGASKRSVESVLFADDYRGFRSGRFFTASPLGTNALLGEEIHRRGGVLIAQIHTHPSEAFHSKTDDLHPVSHKLGFLSVVVPRFGRGVRSIGDCRAYEYRGSGRWSQVRPEAKFCQAGG